MTMTAFSNLDPSPSPACHPDRHAPRMTGVLLRLRDAGYGFIRPDGGGPDFFISINSMRDRAHWVEGQRVEFSPGKLYRAEPGKKSKAPPALDVVAVGKTPAARAAAALEIDGKTAR